MYGRWAPSGDPVAGDWDGDGTETPGFVRGNVWYLNDGFDDDPEHSFAYGSGTDRKIVGDWDGDGTATPGIVRGNRWYLNDNFDPYADRIIRLTARPGDKPVVGDWNGNGSDTPGIVRGNTWYLNDGFDPNARRCSCSGTATDVPVAGDWDGNGTDTPGIVRGSVWYLNNGFGPNASSRFRVRIVDRLAGRRRLGRRRRHDRGRRAHNDWLLRNTNSAGAPDVGLLGRRLALGFLAHRSASSR